MTQTWHTDTTPPQLPREPSAYRPSNHFAYRFKTRQNPPITDRVIETCIREGEIVPTRHAKRWKFVTEIEQNGESYRWWLIVGLSGDPPYTVVTAYCPHSESHLSDAQREPGGER